MLAHLHLLFFIDNLGGLSAAVSGRSAVVDMNPMIGGLCLLVASLGATACFEHVDARANATDGGSRVGVNCAIAKNMGVGMACMDLPPILIAWSAPPPGNGWNSAGDVSMPLKK